MTTRDDTVALDLRMQDVVPAFEIADIVAGRQPGRLTDDEIIVCLNPGSGFHDVAAARYVYHRALELGLGVDLPT